MPLETFAEFERRQACPSVRLANGIHCFRNGARSDGHLQHEDPPADMAACLAIRREYATARLHQAEQDFERYRQQALNGAIISWDSLRYGEPETDDPESLLKQLASIVRVRRAHFRLIEDRIANLPQNIEARRRRQIAEQIDQEQRQRDAEQRRRIAEVSI